MLSLHYSQGGSHMQGQASSAPILSDYLSDAEMAKEMGVSLRTWWRWLALREGPPATKIGRRRYFHRQAVNKWLRSREREVA
jgi:excisionase family DNA binding protein